MLLKDIPQTPPKILLWGKPGVAKTPFVTSYGEGMQLIDCDNGLESSRKFVDKWQPERAKVDVISCLESDPTKAVAFNNVKREVMDIYNKCNAKTYPFKILAIDSFTTLADFALRSIQANSGALNKPGGVTMQMWGLAIAEIDNLFMWLKALPIPVVVIFHDRESDEGGTTTQEIAIFGKNLPRKIISYFDEVLRQKVRIESGKMVPYLQTMSDATSIARSRGNIKDGFKTDDGFRALLASLNWKV